MARLPLAGLQPSHHAQTQTPAAQPSGALPPGRTEAPTGLTPHVGALELPPGIEGIVPSDHPLTGDPSGLQAAAAMGPVVALPATSLHTASVLSMPSEGVPVASGSSM
jgi:hypothetical protein